MNAPLQKTVTRKLDNGLTLLMRPDRNVPVATADIWVRVGSGDEPPEIGGISHFLEHMMFKGTERFATGEIEREIENVGGVSNAATSYDFTHYYITLPSENLSRGMEMLGEMIGGSSLDPTELEKERLVILEEYRRKQDTPAALLYEDVYEKVSVSGPYHRAVIGTEETIRSITREQMRDYYRRHYAPDNMALVLTGDFDLDDATKTAARYFGGMDWKLNPLLARREETQWAREQSHHREKPTGGETYWALACGAPGADNLEALVPLDLAQFILGQGRASILYQEIKEKRRLASTVGCYYSTLRQGSVFMAVATCEPKQKSELSIAIRAAISELAEKGITEAQFHRAKRLLASAHRFGFETTGGASSEIGYYYTLTGNSDFIDGYLERLESATAKDVQRALATMLKTSEFTEVSVGPSEA